MIPPHEKIVLAYVQSFDKDYVFITLALYDHENEKWIDMMQDENKSKNIEVVHYIDIPDPISPYKWFTSLGMYHYRTIYKNNVYDKNRLKNPSLP